MEIKTKIKKLRNLKDFTRLLLAFISCLIALSVYQQLSLYYSGVIEVSFNKTFGLLLLNHLSFSAILAFLILLLFRFLERSKPGMGFRITIVLFCAFLLFEGLLIEHFITNYSLIHYSDVQAGIPLTLSGGAILKFLVLVVFGGLLYYLSYKLSWYLNAFIGKMYPFTIILFIMALGTSITNKRPINQNKTMDFITEATGIVLDFNKYEGQEYPLWHAWENSDDAIDEYIALKDTPPNIVFIVIDGLSNEFVSGGKYARFTPFLDSLTSRSLYWNHFLANSNSKTDAIPNILGSLPQGQNGFTALDYSVNRNTIYGILKKNGYHTGFYYGGNLALKNVDKFLDEEDVDVVLDKSRFNDTYKLQDSDRAGVTLGYPDQELYKKWGASYFPTDVPKVEFFLNLSTSKPFAIPNQEQGIALVKKIKATQRFEKKDDRFITKNIEVFAAMHYADKSLKNLFKMYALTKDIDNTIFVITGSGKTYLPKDNLFKEYQVPLVINSSLVRKAETISTLASHHDIAPSLIQLIHSKYEIEIPQKSTFIGTGLVTNSQKVILSEANKGVQALVYKNHFVGEGEYMKINEDNELNSTVTVDEQELLNELKLEKAINTYVTKNDKVLPKEYAIYETGKKKFSKEEEVWISSVFNGKNYDNAYSIARKLAHEGNYDKSLVLTAYILENSPNNIDALILQGRVYAWKKHYNKSISILEKAVDIHPFYHDGYSALLDVYFWSGNNIRASRIYEKIKDNNIETVELIKKVERCMSQIKGIENDKNQQIAEIQLNGF